MRLLIGRREGSSRRATPAAAPPPCRLHFLMFSALHAEKAALSRRKNAIGTPPTSLAPCRPESFLAAPKRPHEMQPPRFRAEDLDGRTAQRFSRCSFSTNKKGRSFRNALFVGGDKRDRTADLMTASCYRFVIWSVFASNTSVLSAISTGFHGDLSTASIRFRAHLGHNLGQGSWVDLERFCRGGCGL